MRGKIDETIPSILLTIDLEDWFQVENFKSYIPFSSWSGFELRVEANTHRLLDLFDRGRASKGRISATFFVLGWVAERLPRLIREIRDRGHEVASHGYNHDLCIVQPGKQLRRDLTESKKKLEDIIGAPVSGYRAPSFGITPDILEIIAECGYRYDSSYNSFTMHGRYGRIELPEHPRIGIARMVSPGFLELPISNLGIGGSVIPWGGGAYFRLIPFPIFKLGVHAILRKQKAYVFYFHPWEIDADQPRIRSAKLNFRLRHYVNLAKAYPRLSSLLKSFHHCGFPTCAEYLNLPPERENRADSAVSRRTDSRLSPPENRI